MIRQCRGGWIIKYGRGEGEMVWIEEEEKWRKRQRRKWKRRRWWKREEEEEDIEEEDMEEGDMEEGDMEEDEMEDEGDMEKKRQVERSSLVSVEN